MKSSRYQQTFFSDFRYKTLIDNKTETCDTSGDNQIFSKGTFLRDECEKKCNDNEECSFIFYTLKGWCALYKSCTKRRITKKAASTFQKVRTGKRICKNIIKILIILKSFIRHSEF